MITGCSHDNIGRENLSFITGYPITNGCNVGYYVGF